MIIIVFGVAGAGKTTVGSLLAAQLGWSFYDADRFHPDSNIGKMSRGIPLTDEDRRIWLDRVRATVSACLERKESAVMACSALKMSYRRLLKVSDEVKFVFLKGEFGLIEERLKERRAHFAGPDLLQSQFDILEEPRGEALVVDVKASPGEIVQDIRTYLGI